jgi:hypothetical protein
MIVSKLDAVPLLLANPLPVSSCGIVAGPGMVGGLGRMLEILFPVAEYK